MSAVLVDTSYLIALDLASDQDHDAAARHWQSVAANLPQIVVTSFIFDETVTFFNNRGHHAKARQVGNSLLSSPSVQFVHVDPALLMKGWSYLQQHQDKDYSLTDCISFVVMQEMGIRVAYSFDKHFVQAGFAREP